MIKEYINSYISMISKLFKQDRLYFYISLLLSSVICYVLLQSVIDQNYSNKQLYHDAEIRFKNKAGVRISDYLLKHDDQTFLIAPNIPKEVKARIELSHAGRYLAVINAKYPQWLCKPEQVNKAKIRIAGGSLNETVDLITNTSQKLNFIAAKGQSLRLTVVNQTNRKCGRAVLTLYQIESSFAIKIGLILFWLSILVLCIISSSSPYIVTLGLAANTLLVSAQASLGALATESILVNTGFALGFSGIMFFVSALPLRSRIIAFLAMIFAAFILCLSLAFIAYEQVFASPFTIEAVHGAMQSYGSQALEFWSEFVGIKRTSYILIGLFLLYLCMRHVNQARALMHKSIVFGLLLIVTGFALSFGKLHHSGIYNLLLKSAIVYQWEINAFEKVAGERQNFTAQAIRKPEHKNDTTVIVYGESVNRKQMSAYGYVRQTTPFLEKRVANNEAILFTNGYSNHTHSNPTMSLILTQASQYEDKRWQDSPSVFNYASAANIETHWLTNHRLLGGWSNNITTIIREADRLKTINYKIGYGTKSTSFDSQLVPLFKEAIRNKPNQLTFLHLYNSHSFYCNRYPSDFDKYNREFPLLDFGKLLELKVTSADMIDCYDNSIHYADIVLEELVSEINERSNPSVILYVADHAEEFLGNRTHNSAMFTFDMINIPLVIWANKAWRDKHKNIWETLKNNKDKVVTNDLMFESVLGLAGITASSINTKNDITSPRYMEPKNPLTLHGRMTINHHSNWNYWQKQNIRYAKDNNIKLKAVDVESVGEAKVALALGIDQLQVNVGMSPEGEFMLVTKNDKEIIAPLSNFIDGLQQKGVNSASLSLKPSSVIDSNVISKFISDANMKMPLKLLIAPMNQVMPLSLASMSFIDQLTKVEGQFDVVPVVISSRYVSPAPEPNVNRKPQKSVIH